MQDKLKRLIDLIKTMVQIKFTGEVIIHFSEGGIAKVIKKKTVF